MSKNPTDVLDELDTDDMERDWNVDEVREGYHAGRVMLNHKRQKLAEFLRNNAMLEKVMRDKIVEDEILCMKIKQEYLKKGGNINDL